MAVLLNARYPAAHSLEGIFVPLQNIYCDTNSTLLYMEKYCESDIIKLNKSEIHM